MLLEHQSKKKEIHASGNGMGKKIPVADGNRFFGSAKPLLTDPLEFFLNQYKKHGPVYEVHALSRRYVILVFLRPILPSCLMAAPYTDTTVKTSIATMYW